MLVLQERVESQASVMATLVRAHRRLLRAFFCTAALMSLILSVDFFGDQNRVYASSDNTDDWAWLTPDHGDTCLVVESMCTGDFYSDLYSVRLRPCTLTQDTVWHYDAETQNYKCGSSCDCALEMEFFENYQRNHVHACGGCAGKENCKWNAPNLDGGLFELQSQWGAQLCLAFDDYGPTTTTIAAAACTESTLFTWMPQNVSTNASWISFPTSISPSSCSSSNPQQMSNKELFLTLGLVSPLFFLFFALVCRLFEIKPCQIIGQIIDACCLSRRRSTRVVLVQQQSISEEKEKKEEGNEETAPP